MKNVFQFVISYKKIFLTLGAIGAVAWFVYRAIGGVFLADFSTTEIESQTQQMINQIVNKL